MGIDEYFQDIVKSHCTGKIQGKLADCGYFDFFRNRISNSLKEYSISQVYNNQNDESCITVNFSTYVDDIEKWVEDVGEVKVYKDQIDFILDEEDTTNNVIINSKDDLFNLSLLYGLRVSYETLLKLQLLVSDLQDAGISLKIFYGTGEEKEYGY